MNKLLERTYKSLEYFTKARYSFLTCILFFMAGIAVYQPMLASQQDTLMSHPFVVNSLVVFRWVVLVLAILSARWDGDSDE